MKPLENPENTRDAGKYKKIRSARFRETDRVPITAPPYGERPARGKISREKTPTTGEEIFAFTPPNPG